MTNECGHFPKATRVIISIWRCRVLHWHRAGYNENVHRPPALACRAGGHHHPNRASARLRPRGRSCVVTAIGARTARISTAGMSPTPSGSSPQPRELSPANGPRECAPAAFTAQPGFPSGLAKRGPGPQFRKVLLARSHTCTFPLSVSLARSWRRRDGPRSLEHSLPSPDRRWAGA